MLLIYPVSRRLSGGNCVVLMDLAELGRSSEKNEMKNSFKHRNQPPTPAQFKASSLTGPDDRALD